MELFLPGNTDNVTKEHNDSICNSIILPEDVKSELNERANMCKGLNL